MSIEDSSIKLVVLVKRAPGASFAEFQSYYENVHSKMIRHLPAVKRYFRRYLHPLSPEMVNPAVQSYDVIAELWFDNQPDLESSMRILGNPEIHQANAEQEARFIDHSVTQLYIIEERHSDLSVDIGG